MGKPTAIELLDIAYQGIRSRLSGYGGIFIEPDRNVEPKTSYDSNSQLVGLAAGVRTVLPDGKVIQILTRNRKDGPIWRSAGFYEYHIGPSKADMTDVYFRIDLHPPGLHCHIRGEGKLGSKSGGHLTAREVVPDIRTVDALRFLDYVDDFLKTGIIPFRKFGPGS